MATANPVLSLQQEATCSICLEYYTDPVSANCGHNFCRSCLFKCSSKSGTHVWCPQCRAPSSKDDLRHNRTLQNIVEITKLLPLQAANPQENMCDKHVETLKLFCHDDRKSICTVCSMSADHRSHNMSPMDEAALVYKDKLQDWLPRLRKEVKCIKANRLKEEEKCNALRNTLAGRKWTYVAEFKEMHQLLKDKEQIIVSRLGDMCGKVEMEQRDNVGKLSNRITSLDALISEINKKCKQPAEDLLKDVGTTLSRCENVMFLESETMEHCKGKENQSDSTTVQNSEGGMKNYKVAVTLDPDTMNQWLILSEDGRQVRWGNTTQTLPENHRRFTYYPCVLGSDGFTSGRHYWEVQLEEEGDGWHVGAARESISRKEWDTMSPELGLWVVKGYGDHYEALASPPSPISPCARPRKLGVYLDYEGGQLSLHNADTMEHLYTFTSTSFNERIFPFFWLGCRAELHLV